MDSKPLVQRQISVGSRSKSKHRLILKNGSCNIRPTSSANPTNPLFLLNFNKLVDASWTFTLTIFLLVLFVSCFVFAVIWWLICHTHGDFEPMHLPPVQKANNFTPCVYYVHNFASCLLFSIETQHTVGYGVKATTTECPEAIFVNTIQCIFGFILQGIMAVVVFSKMTLPKLRTKTLLFSKQGVICKIGKKSTTRLAMMFRVGDMRKEHIVDARIRAFCIFKTQCSQEGECLQNVQTELNLKVSGCNDNLLFNWPVIVAHEINRNSPFCNMGPSEFYGGKFEIVVVLEGTMQSSGQMTQAKTSYLPNDFLWSYRFVDLLKYNAEVKEFQADFAKFNCVTLCDETPLIIDENFEKTSVKNTESTSEEIFL